jgi:dihydroneopterin aldolase
MAWGEGSSLKVEGSKIQKFNSLMAEFTIELKGLHFFSFHGLYGEEKKVGGEFLVDLFVKFTEKKRITTIDETVSYASLYAIVKEEMNQPRELLETLTQSIADKIHTDYPSLKEIEIHIEKKNPPIIGFMGSVAVNYKKQF